MLGICIFYSTYYLLNGNNYILYSQFYFNFSKMIFTQQRYINCPSP